MELEQQNCIHFWAFSTQITVCLDAKWVPSHGGNWDLWGELGHQARAGRDEMSLCLSRLKPNVPIHPVQCNGIKNFGWSIF